MTARDRFLADLAAARQARRTSTRANQYSRCPQCRRPRAWLCRMGRPCRPLERTPTLHHSDATRERTRRYWLRKYGVAA